MSNGASRADVGCRLLYLRDCTEEGKEPLFTTACSWPDLGGKRRAADRTGLSAEGPRQLLPDGRKPHAEIRAELVGGFHLKFALSGPSQHLRSVPGRYPYA